MELKSDEMGILKGLAIKLDDTTALIVTMQYHTEKNERGKTDRSKSRYRWLARVQKIETINEAIKNMKSDANRLNPWKWPNDPSWDGQIVYTDSGNLAGANWLRMKMKKLVDWDLGQKMLNGWKRTLEAKGEDPYNLKAKYDIEGYQAEDGTIVNLDNKEALLKLVGQNLVKEQQMKSKTAK